MRAIDCLIRPHYLITIYQFYILGLFHILTPSYSESYTVIMYFHSITTLISHKFGRRTSLPPGKLLDCLLAV
jgi:hypothetical protein